VIISLSTLIRVDSVEVTTLPTPEVNMAGEKVSFDYDDTLTTQKGISLLEEAISSGKVVYIISARNTKTGMLPLADKYKISFDKVYATGSNKAKVEKILELGITEHYDNNQDVIDKLPSIGKKI